jgi:hypothetical protein
MMPGNNGKSLTRERSTIVDNSESATTSAMHKLDEFIKTLNPDEQRVIGDLVRSALLFAAAREANADVTAYSMGGTGYVSGLGSGTDTINNMLGLDVQGDNVTYAGSVEG